MSITWNGVSSDTIGVIVERIPNRYVPTRRFSPQQVAGRNGNILLVDKSFPNVEQEYEVYLSAEAQGLPSVARACAEWLMGPDGYCRLEDSYDTTVYREAFLMGGYDLENILNKFGRCTITFSCKPQKYLLTGDTPIEIPAGITTYTGDVVQFDGVTGASITSLSTTITPTQDLHGYSSPWPGGGGKNKGRFASDITDGSRTQNGCTSSPVVGELSKVHITGTANGGTYYFTAPQTFEKEKADNKFLSAGTYTISTNLPRTSGGVNAGMYITGHYTDGTSVSGNIAGYAHDGHPATFTISQDVYYNVQASFPSGYSFGDGMDIWVQIESGSSNTAWTPYSNICPITGRTGLNVYRTGKNYIANATIEQGSFNLNNGNDLASNTRIRTNGKWDVPSGSYKIGCDQGYEYVCYVYGTDGTFIDAESVKSWTNTNIPMTIVGSRKIRCGWRKPDNSAIVPSEISHPFVCVASDIATYSLDWTTPAGTVYHGTVDPVTGQLTVDWVMYTFDGSEAWTASATPHRFSTTISYYLPHPIATQPMTQGATQNVLTSIFGECVYTNADGVGYIVHNSSATLFVVNEPAATTVGDIKAIVNGMQFCYELATPLTYQLTAQEVEVLVGKNNVWTSSGPVSVTVEAPFVGTVTNPTPFEARPMLKVSGVGEITINGKTIQILESVPDFQIDCEAMEAEDNSKIYCMDFPYLEGGENEIAGDGSITALTVTPRWWTL